MRQMEYIGPGSIARCKNVLKGYSPKKVLLVTGNRSYIKSKAIDYLHDMLSGYSVTVLNNVSVNPGIQDVKCGVNLVKQKNADVIIAIGGGSVIDLAKLINFFSANIMNSVRLAEIRPDARKPKPLIAIPTTAGSGSEATHFSVVYKGYKKYSVAHKYILPDVAIVDANLTKSLPSEQSAVSGMDSLSQAVESFWSINSTKESKRYAKEAIKLILPNITVAVNNGTTGSRVAMAKAAHLAGKAINITKTTAPHAVSYPITLFHNIPHGHAVALTLGKFFIINSNMKDAVLNERRGNQYLTKTMNEIKNLFSCASSLDFEEQWYGLMSTLGLESDLKTLGICKQSDLDRIINYVDMDRLCNNPVRITKALLRQVIV